MPQAIFAYHLGMDAEQYAFFRIPKLLITEPYFRRISTDAKLLYGLMLDRMSLSMRYVTEGTFDAYLYQLVESKQKFISQIMTSKSPVRSAEDVDEQALSYAEIKALASGNPMIKEKMDLDIEVSKLKLLKVNHLSQKYALEDAISKGFPKQIAETQARIAGYGADIATVKENTHPNAHVR